MKRHGEDMIEASHALAASRLIWSLVAMGLSIFGAVTVAIVQFERPEDGVAMPPWTPWALWGAFCVGAVLGMFFRGEILKGGWVGDSVEPRAYVRGNILVWAMCAGPGFAAVGVSLLERRLGMSLAVAAAALVVLVGLWPNGRAMWPAEHRG